MSPFTRKLILIKVVALLLFVIFGVANELDYYLTCHFLVFGDYAYLGFQSTSGPCWHST
jgi:hypothetical protein